MKHLSLFLEGVSLDHLFIGFSADGKEQALKKELKNSTFVDWSDLSIKSGDLYAGNIPLSKFKFIMVGVIGDNHHMYSCIRRYVEIHKIKFMSYGTPPERENKMYQTVAMKDYGIDQIKTVIVKAKNTSASALIKELKLPVISKIINGSQGKGIEKHDKKEQLESFLKKNQDEVFIFQEFVPNDGDFRVFYIHDKLVYSIKRTSQSDKEFRNNVSLGGKQEYTELEPAAKKLADKVCHVMEFDITGVDLIQNKKTKKWYVMEINAAPQFTGPEFKKVMAKLIDVISS